LKNIIFVFIGLVILTVAALSFLKTGNSDNYNEQFLRIHIRANSNTQEDQDLKYKVKEKLVDFLTPYLCACDTKQKAVNEINGLLDEIKKIASDEIKQDGYNYDVRASIKHEEFPARSYEGFVLDAGFYDALIVEIGSGTGDNWWCVVYPPLCFVNYDGTAQGVQYRSKLIEIIENFGK